MAYGGTVQETISIKQQELTFYLQAEQAFQSGAQMYKIGNRELQRMDPQKLHAIINQLMLEITMLQSGAKSRSMRVVLTDD